MSKQEKVADDAGEKGQAGSAAPTAPASIGRRMYSWPNGLDGVITLQSDRDVRQDPLSGKVLPAVGLIQIRFQEGFYSTSDPWEIERIENHLAFKSGQIKDHTLHTRAQIRAMEIQLAALKGMHEQVPALDEETQKALDLSAPTPQVWQGPGAFELPPAGDSPLSYAKPDPTVRGPITTTSLRPTVKQFPA